METIKCKFCEEEKEKNEMENQTRDGESICDGCYEYEDNHLSTCIEFNPNEPEPEYYRFNELIGELPPPIKSQKWIKTDGWRGYTDWDLEIGYSNIADGWITGYPDETTSRKKELSEYYQSLLSGKLIPPCKIWWIFGQTSNVFSQTSAIIIETKNETLLKEWLNTIDGGIEHFKEMLS